MAQTNTFMFGIDNISFIDDQYNIYSVDDPQNGSINLTYETTEHRGGANNDVRASAVHSRSGELSIGTGYVDATLAQLLTGGTITSLGTSAASITTGTATGVNTLYGSTASIPTAVTSVIISSPTLVKSTDYYVTAVATDAIKVERLTDGKVTVASATLGNSVAVTIDSDYGLKVFTAGSGYNSLTVGEKAYISARSAINSINQKVVFDNNKPNKLSVQLTTDYNGIRRTIKVPVVQPNGTVQGNSATEFQVQDLTMQIVNSAVLNELADITLQG